MGSVNWQGNRYVAELRTVVKRRTSAAAIRLSSRVKAEISQPGTLRYHPLTKRGRPARSQRTLYNFTHSRPGNPPYKQTGRLRASIAWELVELAGGVTLIGRIGTNVKYGRYLELGTKRMRARPFLRMALRKYWPEIERILLAKIGPGGLAAITSNQFRSGHFGRGARAAGYF